MSATIEDRIDRMLDTIHRDQTMAASQIGWLMGFDNSDIIDKMDNSFSGHVIHVAQYSVWQSVVMFIDRSLQDNGHSLTALAEVLYRNVDLVVGRHANLQAEYPRVASKEVYYAKLSALRLNIETLNCDPRKRHLRILRDSHFGHRLPIDVKKGKMRKEKLDDPSISLKDTIELGLKVLGETRFAVGIWTGGNWEIEDHQIKMKRNCEEFIRIIPKFQDLENIDNLLGPASPA